ncbi:hypothetical protein [Erwinia tracheiphila]|uniref:hypothetical protein n=1 Tax=Erwinia tracheiphila TaxID=65700 RepID=UPI00128CF9FB|nr:hypothetical protein [Erwinia tracheiphila]UIA81766.1 hypothetical protein LU604_13640 [Erwinia tracheiphila]UIA90361.1 hypothetical protein LU632_13205 [Erwinia tracheiphila]
MKNRTIIKAVFDEVFYQHPSLVLLPLNINLTKSPSTSALELSWPPLDNVNNITAYNGRFTAV